MPKKEDGFHHSFKLPGVGKQIAKHLARLEIYSIPDLLLHLPVRYQDRTQKKFIRQLIPDQEAVIEGNIISLTSPQRGKTKLLCEIRDETGKLYLRFFHAMSYLHNTLREGKRLRCFGVVSLGVKGFEIIHPEFQVVDKSTPTVEQHLTPIYPATEGLSQYTLRKLTSNALDWMHKQNTFDELLPKHLLQALSYPNLKETLSFIHRPPPNSSLEILAENKTPAQQRLAFEELLAHRLSVLQLKKTFRSQTAIPLLNMDNREIKFVKQLPFTLTNAQQRVIQEIKQDLSQAYPMLRLLQGDVGSGKTVVAAHAILQAIANNQQVAVMVPTELLAEQHYRTFSNWFATLNIEIVFLSGNVKGLSRKTILNQIASGEVNVVIGTHALFQKDILFRNLALIIVDEQHRFGVKQRALLREKGISSSYPHQLIMTATPIPRTLAMSFYADLDCSLIDELPPGRKPVNTSVLPNARRDEVIARVKEACLQGKQVYWVCPLIEESEILTSQAATEIAKELQTKLSQLKIGLLHGRMKPADKQTIMCDFLQCRIQILVATTVIEVGVDVPNASLMIIENAERLGLAQLHQLRGRVGRRELMSYCILLYQHPLSELAKQRLNVMRETNDGFKIAQCDLELRGPGEVLGTKQTGELTFRIANLTRDSILMSQVHQAAADILQNHSAIISPLINRWLANKQEFSEV